MGILGKSYLRVGSDVVEEDVLYKKVAGHLSLESDLGIIWVFEWHLKCRFLKS